MTDNKKILVIRMLGLGDVTCVGIPAVRYFREKIPEAEITLLTYGVGKDIAELAGDDFAIMQLPKDEWPDNIIQAMERFLGLANEILAEEFDLIVNLDTWFMPCFLARFLKDAGEQVQGNYMSVNVEQLITELQMQTLKHDYVHDPANYMESTFTAMSSWHMPWWEFGYLPDYGYPEYYLRRCCGFDDISMDMSIKVDANPTLERLQKKQKVIALACDARTEERNYPHQKQLTKLLEKKGYHVWTGFDGKDSMRKTLSKLKATDLLVTVPSAPQWLATTVGCPSLVIVGQVDARTLMPDYATEASVVPVAPEQLFDSICSIFEEDA